MIKGVASILAEGKVDSLLLFTLLERPDSHFVYLTGVVRATGCLVVGKKRTVLFVSPLEYGVAKERSAVRDVRVIGKDFYKDLKRLSGRRVGMNYDYLSINRLKKIKKMLKVESRDVSRWLAEMRMVKGRNEVDIIAEACSITDKVLQKVYQNARSMRTEDEMKMLIEGLMRERGVEPSFDVIVASGKDGAVPHHVSGTSKLKGMTIIDLGVRLREYCSDVTRTICFGEPKRRELEAYRLVRQVQENCISMVRAGEDFNIINQYAQKRIGKPLLHGIGHGLGIDVHEWPFVTKEKKSVLKEGMVITIEPGAYYPGRFGIRIEDDIVVEKERGRVLSKTGKDLLIV